MIVTGFEILDCPVKPGNDNKYVDGRDNPGHDELVLVTGLPRTPT